MAEAKPKTFAAIGRALGEPPSSVAYWASQGAPIVSGKPNDVAAIRAWLVSWRATNPAKSAPQKSEQAQKLAEAKLMAEVVERRHRNRLLEMKIAKEEGRLISIEAAEAELRSMATTVRSALLALPRKVAPQLVNVSARAAEAAVREAIDEALRLLTDQPA